MTFDTSERVSGAPSACKLRYVAGIASLVLALLAGAFLVVRQEPWEDEIFGVSTGWSLARSQGQTLSVLADYPGTGSPIPFYGPVSFYAAATLFRAFGLSWFTWRLVCFLGVVLCSLVCAALVRAGGGVRFAQWAAALLVLLSASLGGTFPGRWDFVTAGLFCSGILIFVTGIHRGRAGVLSNGVLAALLLGLALASSPRALTLVASAITAAAFSSIVFREMRKRILLTAMVTFAFAGLIHSLLLLPWGLNVFSWYSYLRHATKADYINATPMLGGGLWVLDLQHHKLLILALPLLLAAALAGALRRGAGENRPALEIRIFVTVLAGTNVCLMLMMLENALGQTAFWAPPVVAAMMCWVHAPRGKTARVSFALVLIAVGLLSCEELEQVAAVALTWNRRNPQALTAFVRQTIPSGSPVYGPVGSYFYAVELAGSQYLYPSEHTTPGLYASAAADTAGRMDARICSRAGYAMWPIPEPGLHPEEQSMPEPLRERLGRKVAEFDQPRLEPWKALWLGRMGAVGGKFGFPDVAIYELHPRHCSAD